MTFTAEDKRLSLKALKWAAAWWCTDAWIVHQNTAGIARWDDRLSDITSAAHGTAFLIAIAAYAAYHYAKDQK
jgi:hypothetical protein